MPAQQQALSVGCYFMAIIITIERLKIYAQFNGDIDSFSRTDSKKYKEIFDNNVDSCWSTISSKIQDIGLISNQLASQDYADKTLKELKDICDVESFKSLTAKIPFYGDFQKIANLLQEIKKQINLKTDTIWAGFDSVEIFLKELDLDIERIKLCSFATLDKINVDFAVTSTYQELSLSNGWSDAYLKIAEEFDKLYDRIATNKYPADINQYLTHKKGYWWKFW